jgi:hypothetical protein
MAIISGMKKRRQKLSCAPSFGNTETKSIATANSTSRLPQIALHHYWKANLKGH